MTGSLRIARLMNLMNAFREGEEGYCLQQDEEWILSFIYERAHKEVSTTVSDLVIARSFGTPPTVQRKVNKLAKNGLLVYAKDKSDSRKQNLALSDSAILYLEKLEKHLAISCE